MQHIFSESLALVQGPPGCGKTYVGVKAVEVMVCRSTESPSHLPPLPMIGCPVSTGVLNVGKQNEGGCEGALKKF